MKETDKLLLSNKAWANERRLVSGSGGGVEGWSWVQAREEEVEEETAQAAQRERENAREVEWERMVTEMALQVGVDRAKYVEREGELEGHVQLLRQLLQVGSSHHRRVLIAVGDGLFLAGVCVPSRSWHSGTGTRKHE